MPTLALILPAQGFFFVLVVLRSRQLFHTTYKLYMTSLVCQVLYLLIMCINYGKYANDGIEDRGLETFGKCTVWFCHVSSIGHFPPPPKKMFTFHIHPTVLIIEVTDLIFLSVSNIGKWMVTSH